MLSRSSSTYQPLDQATASEAPTPAVPRRNYSGTATTVKIQGTVPDTEDDEDPMCHEMTSIAIISQHPLRSNTATVVTRDDTKIDLEYKLSSIERRRACVNNSKDSSWNWTNFHFVMCIGVVGFLVFWVILLCRMYLPSEYQFWAKPKP